MPFFFTITVVGSLTWITAYCMTELHKGFLDVCLIATKKLHRAQENFWVGEILRGFYKQPKTSEKPKKTLGWEYKDLIVLRTQNSREL